MKPRRVLVTGGAGFIGSHLTHLLVVKGCQATVIDNLRTGGIQNLGDCARAVRVVEGDIRDLGLLRAGMQGVEVVFHLAAQSNVIGACANVDYALSANVVGTANVVLAALDAGVRRLVLTSSREVYGEPAQLPVPETAALFPKNAYGMSKLASEMCCAMTEGSRLETTIVRIANVYGPHDRGRVIPLFIENALTGAPLVVYGGTQTLDFVPVDYVVDVLVRLGLGDHIPGPINIGSGYGTTIMDLAGEIIRLANSSSELRLAKRRNAEVSRFVADTAKAARLGFALERPSLSDLANLIRGQAAAVRDNWLSAERQLLGINP